MTYDPGIPQPQNDPSEDQPKILTNFSQLNTQFGVNHGAFDNATIPGKHKFATFPELSASEVSALNPKADEVILFAQDDSGNGPEFFTKQYGLDPRQFTKQGFPFLGIRPQAACNWARRSGTGAVTPDASWNIASVNQDGDGKFTLTFTNDILDATGSPTADYMWNIHGFDDSSNPVFAGPAVSGTYSSSVDPGFIKVEFRNQNGTLITTLTRASLIIWSIQ